MTEPVDGQPWWNEARQATTEHLDLLLNGALSRSRNGSVPALTGNFATLLLSCELLRFFMGNQWTNENAFYQQTNVSRANRVGRKYLHTEQSKTDGDAMFRWMSRVTILAECLFNMQKTPGIQHRIDELRHGDLESGMGELQCARILSHPGFGFRFIVPAPGARRGSCYESEFETPTGRTVCCEIKTKRENAKLTGKTIINTLETARKQLRPATPGIVILQLPEAWIKDQQLSTALKNATDRMFRHSDRLTAIVVTWEQWFKLGVNRANSYGRHGFYNRDSPYFSDCIEHSFLAGGASINPKWLSLQQYAANFLNQNGLPALSWRFHQPKQGE